ncbi:MAG: di-heme oxidoredictase family protein [Bacteroidota bacterium]
MKSKTAHLLSSLFVLLLSFACEKEQGMSVDLSEEEMSGGANFTTFDFSGNAFGGQGKALSREESRLFVAGNALFKNNWVAAPASVESLDGLGPIYNATSCGSCHFKDGRAAPPDEFAVAKSGLLWRLNIDGKSALRGAAVSHTTYGGQIQDQAILKVRPEAKVNITYQEIVGKYADGTTYRLQKPIYELADLAYGKIEQSYQLSPRIATHLAGIGLLESISEKDILANEDINDDDKDGISGKANYVWNVKEETNTLGRFGWKANQPNITQQNAGAFNGDMGLTSSFFPEDVFTPEQEKQNPNLLNGGDPEVSDEQLFRISLYVQALAVPAKRNMDTPKYQVGRELFMKIGCESCHKASFTTQTGNVISSLDKQKIYAYTDLLLHDMGEGLADNSPDFEATGSEWRTAPLWGIGLIKTVNNHTRLLHDGRARNVEEAILWHGGEASQTTEKFKQLNKDERDALIFFVNSL